MITILSWIILIVLKWWIQKSYTIWKSRNEHLHNPLFVNKTRSELETLEQVRHLYELSEQLSANDKEQFQISLSERIKQPWRTLKSWVQITAPVVNTCIQVYSDRIRQTNTNIRTYISRRQTNIQHVPETTAIQTTPAPIRNQQTQTHNTNHNLSKTSQSPPCCCEDQVGL